tara:strand:+ start:66 stop:464 length:399 start_codon:yes stop_codon:yes gene_type:complete
MTDLPIEMNRRTLLSAGGLALLGTTTLNAEKEKNDMFYHLHYFRFKDDVPEEEIATLMKELAALKDKIPVLKEFWVGKNISPNGKGFQYGEVALFEKPEDLQAYDRHPEHRKMVKKIGPKLAGGASMDFIPL